MGEESRDQQADLGERPSMPLDTSTRAHLVECVQSPPVIVRVPGRFTRAFAARRKSDTRRLVQIGGASGIVLALIIVGAGSLFFDEGISARDRLVYEKISVFNFAVILLTAAALRIPKLFDHYRYLMLLAGSCVLGATHAGSILIENTRLAMTASYATMLGITVVTIGFRNGLAFSTLTCALGGLAGSAFAVYRGATPDWPLVSYGYVGATAVGLVIAWILERQEVLHFFQSLLLAHESEERLRLNRQLEEMSRTDALSGLANRRSFDDTLDLEWARMRRDGTPMALVFVDVDHFKRFNDTYGHREGDACLRAVGQALKSSVLRPADLAARYGGEEFVLLLPNTDVAGAHALARRALEAVDALEILHSDSPTHHCVSVSMGVATTDGTTELEPRHLVDTADAALYRAKHEGRRRIASSDLRGDSLRPHGTMLASAR